MFNSFIKINTTIVQNRPQIILKFAQSKDGFIGQPHKQVWLTNAYSKILTHKWRSEIDAILVGTNTVQIDNPNLTNRLYFGSHPIRIVIDKKLKLSNELAIFNELAPTIIINESKSSSNTAIHYLQIKFDEQFWESLLAQLFKKGIKILMIEGGAYTLQSIIDANLWDEARILKAPTLLSTGIPAPNLNGRLIASHQILEDTLEIYRP